MTNKEILEKAIQKAIEGGWVTLWAGTMCDWRMEEHPVSKRLFVITSLLSREVQLTYTEEIIFNHGFARALWGEGELLDPRIWVASVTAHAIWQYHLQMMVISDDPIKYLGENI